MTELPPFFLLNFFVIFIHFSSNKNSDKDGNNGIFSEKKDITVCFGLSFTTCSQKHQTVSRTKSFAAKTRFVLMQKRGWPIILYYMPYLLSKGTPKGPCAGITHVCWDLHRISIDASFQATSDKWKLPTFEWQFKFSRLSTSACPVSPASACFYPPAPRPLKPLADINT